MEEKNTQNTQVPQNPQTSQPPQTSQNSQAPQNPQNSQNDQAPSATPDQVDSHINSVIDDRTGTKQWRKGSVAKESQKSTSHRAADGGKIIWAIFLVYFGAMLLLNTTGLIPWSIWGLLWRFWPVLIVLTGIKIILGRSCLMNIIIGLLTAASFGIITLFALIAIGSPIVADLDVRVPEFLMERFFYTGDSINDELTIEAQQYENIEKRDLRIDLGAGKFSVKDVVSEDYLQVDAYYYDGIGEPDLTSAFKNQKLDIDFDIRSGALNWGGKTRTPEYDFLIGRQDIPTNLFVNLGVGSAALNLDGLEIENVSFDVGGGDMEIDISGLEVKKFESEVGSGQMNINLRNSEVAQGIDIKVGAGRIKLTVPSDVGYSIQYDLGLGTINTPQEDISGSNKGNIVSPNYESASKILDIKLEVGVGRFEIDY